MLFIKDKITNDELKILSKKMYDHLVKAVVDIEQEVMVVDAPLHSDEEELLLEQGSLQDNLWGINIYPNEAGSEKWIEFDSMINIRPALDNKSRYIEDPKLREKIIKVVKKLVQI
jgi:hypothetical protein